MHSSVTLICADPTNHGSNVGAVALFAMGIFVLIGALVFLITRRGRRPLRPGAAPESKEPAQPREQGSATDAKAP